MVLRDTYSGGVLQSNSRIYTLNDTNYNVTALVTYNATTQAWGVSERFVYSPYGAVEVFDAKFNSTTDAFSWQYMYQGGRFDSATGLYHFGARNYSPMLGIWVSQDPLQYINGANAYQFVMGNPIDRLDPSGRCLSCWFMSVEFALIPAEAGIAVYDSRAILVALAGGEAAEPAALAVLALDLLALKGTVLAFVHHASACEKCDPCPSNIKKVEADKRAVKEKVNDTWEDAKKVWEAVKKIGEMIKYIPEP